MATRSRFRQRRTTRTDPYQLVYRFSGGSVFSTQLWGNFEHLTWAERFADEYEAPKAGYFYPDHSCNHERISGTTENVGTWTSFGITGGFEPDRRWITSEAEILSTIPVIPPEVLDDIAFSAMTSFVTDIEQEGSILNFLYELKDLESLFGPLGGLWSRFLEWITKPGLTWSFVIKPMIEDLTKFFGALHKVKRKLEFLEKFDGKETILNYNAKHVEKRMNWAPEEPVSGQTWPFPPLTIPYCSDLEITVRCHARVQIRCRGIRDALRRLDAYMKAYGVGSIIQWVIAFWKGLPFSWLFDWIFKTNRLFAALNTSTFGEYGLSPITVLTTTHSIRVSATVKIWALLPGPYSPKIVGTYKVKRYSRAHGLPYDLGVGSIFRFHNLVDSTSMLAILLQILLPGFAWKRIFRKFKKWRWL